MLLIGLMLNELVNSCVLYCGSLNLHISSMLKLVLEVTRKPVQLIVKLLKQLNNLDNIT